MDGEAQSRKESEARQMSVQLTHDDVGRLDDLTNDEL